MLFENDGSPADIANAFTEIVGDGAVMDAMRRKLASEQDGRRQREIDDFNAIAARVNETERVANNETGLIPDFSVPALLYHTYAADFKMKAIQEGITLEGNGYECWACPEFIAWFKKRHPELVHKEAPRAATIIVPAGKYTLLPAALAA